MEYSAYHIATTARFAHRALTAIVGGGAHHALKALSAHARSYGHLTATGFWNDGIIGKCFIENTGLPIRQKNGANLKIIQILAFLEWSCFFRIKNDFSKFAA